MKTIGQIISNQIQGYANYGNSKTKHLLWRSAADIKNNPQYFRDSHFTYNNIELFVNTYHKVFNVE